jgi:hypothetical protein
MINAYRILMWKPLEKQPFGRPRRRWKDSIKTDFRQIGSEDGRWMELHQ